MKNLSLVPVTAIAVSGIVAWSSPARAGCPCEANVNNDTTVNVIDVAIAIDCANGTTCGGCVNSCDVNCDGEVDFVDVGVVWCDFVGEADCCNRPDGACSIDKPDLPSCIETYERACTDEPGAFEGTYHGDNSVCLVGGPTVIPTVSEWGLAAMTLLVLSAGTVVLRSCRTAS